MSRERGTYRIGIDVGGTNTDAVIMRGREVLAAVKTPTTADVGSGIQTALIDVLRQAEIAPAGIGFDAAVFGWPIVGEFDFGTAVADPCVVVGRQEDQGEPPLLIIEAAYFLEAQQFEELHRGLRITDPDHGVEIIHAPSPCWWCRREIGGGASPRQYRLTD